MHMCFKNTRHQKIMQGKNVFILKREKNKHFLGEQNLSFSFPPRCVFFFSLFFLRESKSYPKIITVILFRIIF